MTTNEVGTSFVCRLETVTNELLEISLVNGRSVAVSEYGDKEGAPIFFCHGWPSSRTMAELTESGGARIALAHHFSRPARNSKFILPSR